ncbi:efflux RND transporter periplasmic adaptor subunit [Massilia sp. W12]|uniref:efflux RND transporter periplasmic adaptor subunit n=1 Tax=Massilia sp. W12 TaxID=3126507 RepID=UPI0030CD7DFA
MSHRIICAAILLALAACKPQEEKKTKEAEQVLTIVNEDIHQVKLGSLVSGPVVTGSVVPEKRADLRAEVSAMVLQVLKDNGDVVKRGDLLMRLDDTAIRDSLRAAEAGVRAAQQALLQAERQLERQKTLRASGMTSNQALEDAELRRDGAKNDLAAARAHEVQARQQLTRTEVRAPFDGIVSDRKSSVGDSAMLGKELLKVFDPSSMRFEGLVAADKVGQLKVGQKVSFKVNGYAENEFSGVIKRIDPSADSVTRQVALQISFEGKAPAVAGLFAEGRIESNSQTRIVTLPENVLVKSGDASWVWLVNGARLEKRTVQLGERDMRSGEWAVKAGLQAGDKVLRNPGSNVRDGQSLKFGLPQPASASASASASVAASAR